MPKVRYFLQQRDKKPELPNVKIRNTIIYRYPEE